MSVHKDKSVFTRLIQPSLISGLLLLAIASCTASEMRILSLLPGGAAGEWDVTVDLGGKASKMQEKLGFFADGAPVAATIVSAEDETLKARLHGVPAAASLLSAGMKNKPDSPLASARFNFTDAQKASFTELSIYHIMMEDFRNGDPGNDGRLTGWRHPNYAGGDLKGVLDSLDYIRGLGMNAIWLSPIFAAQTSHGYDVMNYYQIGDAVGVAGDPAKSLELFRQLVREAHAKGLKIILDVPLNHAHKQYQRDESGDPLSLKPRATEARQEAEKLWESWGASYGYWDFSHQPTRKFLIEAAVHWLRDEGADGLRLDYVRGVPSDFWAELYAAVKQAKPDAFLVGECWIDKSSQEANSEDIAKYYEKLEGTRTQFDSLLDFPMQITMTEVFAQGKPVRNLEKWLQQTAALYGETACPTYFFDNHDLARFMAWTSEPKRLTAALTFMASLSSPLVMFYGTETGLSHGMPQAGFTDAGRIPMPWDGLNQPLVDSVKQIFSLRQTHPALTRGGRLPLFSDKTALVMAKTAPEETVLVAVNLASSARELDAPVAGLLADQASLTCLNDSAGSPAAVRNGQVHLTLPPLTVLLFAAPAPAPLL